VGAISNKAVRTVFLQGQVILVLTLPQALLYTAVRLDSRNVNR